MIINEKDYLAHYGTPRHSGRYPWGSGDEDTTRNKTVNDYADDLKRQGFTDEEIEKGMKVSTTRLRARKTIQRAEEKQAKIAMAQRLRDKGLSNVAIGDQMKLNESSVRALLAPGAADKANLLFATSNMLKDEVGTNNIVDIGRGVENHINVSKEKLNAAVAILEEKGYMVHNVPIPQLATGHDTTTKVLCPPGMTQKEAWERRDEIKSLDKISDDGGRTFYGMHEPIKVNPSRVAIRYGDEGGAETDGVIYVRPGVNDLSLGNARYAQVRIAIGNDHYMKGMAIYKDDLPNGVDLLFNTNKGNTGHKLDALKANVDDKTNPFGTLVNQIVADKGGKNEHVTSAMNIVYEEGDWGKWSKTIASQVLSKQSPQLIKSQLDMTYESRINDFAAINSLTNLTVKRKMLDDFASSTDNASVHLKAAHMPRQGWHAILPIESLPDNQIYAPNYDNGDRVAVIRYPHGGTFEIPELTVNNRHPESRKLIGNARDAVGFNHTVAKRLSGADFDGDTVLVIRNNSGRIKATPALEGLKNFDAKASYPEYPGMTIMTGKIKQQEMGSISNLITDMTIQRASADKIAQAVRHSMVVIDAQNHKLNYKQSYIDNGIAQLKQEYQGRRTGGASTLISKAGAKIYVPVTKPRSQKQGGPIDPVTGKVINVPTGKMRRNKEGVLVPKLMRVKRLSQEEDAAALSSGTPIERMYVEHSNKLKALANTARLASFNTPHSKYSPSAKRVYANEVKSLDSKLDLAARNAPLERKAQRLANTMIKARNNANPNMDDATKRKIRFQSLEEARSRMGAKKDEIKITDSEWQAIQSGAVSEYKMTNILKHADMKVVRELATPPKAKLMTTTKLNRAHAMLENGYTREEIASHLGVSISTLDKAIYG